MIVIQKNKQKRVLTKVAAKKDQDEHGANQSEYSVGGTTTANSLNCPTGVSDQHRYLHPVGNTSTYHDSTTLSMRSANITHTEVALSDKLSSRHAYRSKKSQGPVIVEIEDEEQKIDSESQIFMRPLQHPPQADTFEGIDAQRKFSLSRRPLQDSKNRQSQVSVGAGPPKKLVRYRNVI